ncbi:MAG: hypothetical protein ABSG63_17470 [Spirochaetia bacterium]|jgi:hypothetical protein
MEEVVYQEMSAEENALDWRITTRVMSDAVLMKTLQESQSSGEKHAVIAIVHAGELAEAYVSPAEAVRKSYPFAPVGQAFDAYTIDRGVCLLIVRDGKAVISINGVV